MIEYSFSRLRFLIVMKVNFHPVMTIDLFFIMLASHVNTEVFNYMITRDRWLLICRSYDCLLDMLFMHDMCTHNSVPLISNCWSS